jgi:hypothetical protein
MDLKFLQQHIRNLAIVKETDSHVVSCYLNLGRGVAGYRNALNERVGMLRKNLTGKSLADFEDALARIEEYLLTALSPASKGVALFARGGAIPFFIPLQFRVPLPNWIGMNSTPNIYHLVELKDTYHRFVVMIATNTSVRIVEVNLGEATQELWSERPELRKRVGRGWAKDHYQNHRRDRTEQFIKEEIHVLEQLMLAGGHSHLILAGNPRTIARVRKALPKYLAAKLVKTTVGASRGGISEVISATLASFVEQEELESLAVVDRLQQEIHTGGLAVADTRQTLSALQNSQVDVLVMARDYSPDPGWMCSACGTASVARQTVQECVGCGFRDIRSFDPREEMVRIAERSGCVVEIVNHSEVLMRHGGVGALLRFLLPEQQRWTTEATGRAIKPGRLSRLQSRMKTA